MSHRPLGMLLSDLFILQFTLSLNSAVSAALKKILYIDKERWSAETEEIANYFKIFGDKLPKELSDELAGLKERLAQ